MSEAVDGWFDWLTGDRARGALLVCCASDVFAERVLAGRPYGSLAAAQSAAAAACAELSWDDVLAALAAHPRIGERPVGSGRAAALSLAEQSRSRETATGAEHRAPSDAPAESNRIESRAGDGPAEDTAAELAAVNRAYERRFGHVFLICAAELSATDILAAAHQRLAGDEETERRVVRTELAAIAVRRLRTLAAQDAQR